LHFWAALPPKNAKIIFFGDFLLCDAHHSILAFYCLHVTYTLSSTLEIIAIKPPPFAFASLARKAGGRGDIFCFLGGEAAQKTKNILPSPFSRERSEREKGEGNSVNL